MGKTLAGTVKATGAKAGDYLIGAVERRLNTGLRIKIYQDQKVGHGGRVQGPFDFLAAGNGTYSKYTADWVGESFLSADEFVAAVQSEGGQASKCRHILNCSSLRVEGRE